MARHRYDAFGNLDCVTIASHSGSCLEASSSQLVKDYGYDYLDRLISYASYAGGSRTDDASYTYDALDRVVSQDEGHNLAGTPKRRTTTFSYLGLTDLVTQEDFSGPDRKYDSKTYSYDAYGNRISMTNDAVDNTQDKSYTYAYDVHGSVSMLLDESSNATVSYGYDAYGDKDGGLSGNDGDDQDPLNAFRYTGKRFDSGSGTLDMGARRFGPDSTRFLQQDQYMGALSDLGLSLDPLTQNRYSLAGGNPVSFIESDGHRPVADGRGTAGAAQSGLSSPDGWAASSTPSGSGSNSNRSQPVGGSAEPPADSSSPGSGFWSSLGWDVLQETATVSSGIANALTIGQMNKLQDSLGLDQYVDRDAANYKASEWIGTAASAVVGGAAIKGLSQVGPLARAGRVALSCINSFTRGTKVALASGGLISIEKVKVGTRVLSARPGQPDKLVKRRVTWLIQHRDPELYRLRVAGEVIEATGNHPIWVQGSGWVEVRELREGAQLRLINGDLTPLLAIEEVDDKTPVVYNFEVLGTHTYFVGESGLLVHNCGPLEEGMQAAKGFTSAQRRQFEGQLATNGPGSLVKSAQSLQRRLDEHLIDIQTYRQAGGFTSAVEKELVNFQSQINAIVDVLGGL